MGPEEIARLMETYRSIEGERFQEAVGDAVSYLQQRSPVGGEVLYSLWKQLQREYGPLQVMTIVNDALVQLGARYY